MSELLDQFAWRAPARENAEMYQARNPALWEVISGNLEDILGNRVNFTHSPHMLKGQLTYVALFGVRGGSEEYMLAWVPPGKSAAPIIAYCGPRTLNQTSS